MRINAISFDPTNDISDLGSLPSLQTISDSSENDVEDVFSDYSDSSVLDKYKATSKFSELDSFARSRNEDCPLIFLSQPMEFEEHDGYISHPEVCAVILDCKWVQDGKFKELGYAPTLLLITLACSLDSRLLEPFGLINQAATNFHESSLWKKLLTKKCLLDITFELLQCALLMDILCFVLEKLMRQSLELCLLTFQTLRTVIEQSFNNYFSFFPCLLLFGFVDDIIKGQQHESDFISFYFCLSLFGYLLSLISYLLILLSLAHILLEDIWTISYWLISLG